MYARHFTNHEGILRPPIETDAMLSCSFAYFGHSTALNIWFCLLYHTMWLKSQQPFSCTGIAFPIFLMYVKCGFHGLFMTGQSTLSQQFSNRDILA